MVIRFVRVFLLAFILSPVVNGQLYLDLMNDPSSNMSDIQNAANDYFSKVGTGKGTGYVQYKRWEHENISKTYPLGNLNVVDPVKAKMAFDSFNKTIKHKSATISEWKSLGPDNINVNNGHYSPGLGRIDRIAVDPKSNNAILYIGGPANGIWKSVDGGLNWISKTDNIGNRGVSGIVVDHQNSQKVYWATGDGDYNSINCTGILISEDAGESWNMSGLSFPYANNYKGRKLIMHPTDNNELLFSSSRGIYKTINGGQSWILQQSGDFDDIWYKKDEPQIVYASKVGAFYRSINGGASFSKINIELQGRVFIALSDAEPNAVFLMTGRKGIYKSTDKGESFLFVSDHQYTKGEMWHHGTFTVSPSDSKLIHTGEFETHKSLDGGYSWVKTSGWTFPSEDYIHCDIHDFVYSGSRLFVCTDGGVSYSDDEGENWVNLFNTMVALEPYRMGICKTNPNIHMNGSQDNGIYLWDGVRWDGLFGADGMECLIDYINPQNKYFVIQNGTVYAIGKDITQPGAGDWVSPIVMHPTNPSVIYFGNDKVRKTDDAMKTWSVIGSFGTGNVNNLAISESNANYLYASKGARIWKTENEGTLWTDITNTLPNYWITRIAVHPNDPLKVAVSLGGYVPGKKVFMSDNGGATWTNISKQLPNIQARCLAFDDLSSDALYLGMDIGVFYIDNTLSDWELYSDGYPKVGVNDLKINHASDLIFAASHGRGIWKNRTKNALLNCSAAGSESTTKGWITKVSLGSIDNSSQKSSYSDFSDVYTELIIAKSYVLNVTLNDHDSSDTCFAWIDSNNNKEFEPSELITFSSFNEQHQASAAFTISSDIAPGYYSLRIRNQHGDTTPNACGNSIEGEVEDYSVLIKEQLLQYCNAAGASGTGGDWIKNVTINTLNNTSDKSAYSDFTNKATELIPGDEYTIKVTLNYHFEPDKCGAWIDFNQNSEFEPSELINIPLTDNANHIFLTKFSVPANAETGKTLMRVRVVYNNSLMPCNSIFGEVEDYSVVMKSATSIKNVSNKKVVNQLKVYPNPVKSELNIELLELSAEPLSLHIYNTKGDLMYLKNSALSKQIKVKTDAYPSGLYFIKLVTKNGITYSRFVVN